MDGHQNKNMIIKKRMQLLAIQIKNMIIDVRIQL